MTYFMPHILEFFGSISKTFTSPEQRRFWIPTTCWFNKCFKIRQKRRIIINTFFTTSTRNTYFIIRRRLPIFKFIATLFNCIFRNTRCTRNYADAAFANAKELQEYNFKYFVTDIAFDDYLGKWNYRAIPKVKTRSYFLAIPKPINENLANKQLKSHWNNIDWKAVETHVNRLQVRITKAVFKGKWNLGMVEK